ncbi:luciferase [Streptosporangium violaceochromogenes]|nr:luciferase [Streptosporangium violaceochromogenes]
MTGHPLTFGVMTYEAEPWPELTARWEWFERLGLDSLWAGDHVWSSIVEGRAVRPRFDAWLLLAGMAAATTRPTLGPLVSGMPFRGPAMVAKQAVTLDHMSAGRLVLGLGAGGNPADHAACGVPLWGQDERVARFGEYVEIVRGMLSEDTFDYAGAYYQATGTVRAPAPVQPAVPLTIAAHVPGTLRVAARHADTWSSYGTLFSQMRRGVTLSEEEAVRTTARRAALLDEYAAEQGRDPSSIRRSFLAGFTADRPFASVEAFRDFVGRYREIGITEFVFLYPGPGGVDPVLFEKICAEVVPDLRAAG